MSSNPIPPSSLRNWLIYIEIASLVAVAITIITGGAALFLRKRIDEIEQIEKKMLELEIQETIGKADSASLKAEQARLGQKEAELKAKSIELELEKLRLSVMDRVLPSDKIPEIKKLISQGAGSNIDFSALSTDIEAVNYMNQLVELFKSCGWIVHNHTPILYGKPIPPGIEVSINNEELNAKATLVIKCFNLLGFTPDYYLYKDQKNEIEVIVGPKIRKQSQ